MTCARWFTVVITANIDTIFTYNYMGKLCWDTTTIQVNSALHFSRAKLSTSFGWGKGGKVTSAGWQVTLCDSILDVISRSDVVIPRTAISMGATTGGSGGPDLPKIWTDPPPQLFT